MTDTQFNQKLMGFLDGAPTPYHAVATLAARLRGSGFVELSLREPWQLEPNRGYWLTRNGSSLVAFRTGMAHCKDTGIRMAGAHTDSPCLKLKPNPISQRLGYVRIGVEVYGGVLLNPWFDRDLSLAGRIYYRATNGSIDSALVDFKRAVAFIPSLAIHLDREVNQNRTINAQKDIPPVLMHGDADLPALLGDQLRLDNPGIELQDILDWELSFYDLQRAAYVGITEQFIASARLDNLVSCFALTEALCTAEGHLANLIVLNDHEEVGSASASGAQGTLLDEVLDRWLPNREHRSMALARSLMVSADNAHGIHPNYPDRHDEQHGPLLNKGPVLKVNSNQRYASNSETQALLRDCARRADVPLQSFVTRTDLACGSTIGPLTATKLGVRTVDIGIPQWAMHSIRETCGAEDPVRLKRLLTTLFETTEL